MTGAARDVSKQIGLIARANREHTTASATLLGTLTEIRQITERNAQAVRNSARGGDSLIQQTQSLNETLDRLVVNGSSASDGKKRKNKKKSKR